MSQKNVDWVKASLEHFARTGEPYLVGVDASVEVFDHDIPDARNPYRGIEGISAWLADFGESWDSYEMDIKRILDAGDRVVALFRIRAVGAGSGARVERDDGSCGPVGAERSFASTTSTTQARRSRPQDSTGRPAVALRERERPSARSLACATDCDESGPPRVARSACHPRSELEEAQRSCCTLDWI
jgi:ketosteroid isomerase-like protein